MSSHEVPPVAIFERISKGRQVGTSADLTRSGADVEERANSRNTGRFLFSPSERVAVQAEALLNSSQS